MRAVRVLSTLVCATTLIGISGCSEAPADVVTALAADVSDPEWSPTWDPCTAVPEDVIVGLGLGGRPPQPEAPQHNELSLTCGFIAFDSHYTVLVTAHTESLTSRRADSVYTTVRESWLADREVLVSHFPNLSCHYAVGIEPGLIDFQVRYNAAGPLIRTLDEACSLAQQAAEGFAPYFPERLDS
ncbi:MAG: DUF3558 domain-containing protein [Rhodococcus sp.]|nr:DUF3558 domain-containing protein [Rhodococcus sp. (in: high G+C Gram-positive bacteria)]